VVREVPITFSNRTQGTSKLKLKDIIEFVYRAYKLNPHAPIQRFVRFGFVGACGSVVNLLVLSFLVKAVHIDVLIAVVCAIEISILFNFFLNHFYTFRGYGSFAAKTRREPVRSLLGKMGIYNLGTLGGAAISFVTFTVLFKLAGINYLFADVMGIFVAFSWNYYVSTRYVWRAIDEEDDSAS
jgi:dolichol-phosphate mannosyltransferase